jgi:hypothetical protein
MLIYSCAHFDPVLDYIIQELHVECIRFIWRALPLASILLVLGAVYLVPSPPSNSNLIRHIKTSLKPFLTLAEAQTLLRPVPNNRPLVPNNESSARKRNQVLRLTVPISTLALLETIAWMAMLAYYWSFGNMTFALVSMTMALSWGYTFVRPLFRPTVTPPFDIALLLLTQLSTGVLGLFGHAYDRYATSKPWPSGWVFVGEIIDLVIIFTLLVVIFRTPVEAIDEDEVDPMSSPEDYATIWGWMTFGFVNPLIEKVPHSSPSLYAHSSIFLGLKSHLE